MAVLVIGNAAVDHGFEVSHLPAPGETLLAANHHIDIGGKGLNQALVAARAGAAVRLRAVIGDDPDAELIRDRLMTEPLGVDGLIQRPGATDRSIVWIARSGENAIVSTDRMARSLSPADVDADLDALGPQDLVLLQGNLTRAATEAVLVRARRQGAITMVNAAPLAFDYTGLWPEVTVAVVNQVEAGALGQGAEPMPAAQALRAAGAALVVVTLGAAGAMVIGDQAPLSIEAPPTKAIDTTGAGDVVCGVLAAAFTGGLGPVDGVGWAMAAAALSVGRRGTASAFPTAAELDHLRPRDR